MVFEPRTSGVESDRSVTTTALTLQSKFPNQMKLRKSKFMSPIMSQLNEPNWLQF